MWEDEIVAEVRAVRLAHAEKFKFDLRAIYLDLKEQEQQEERRIVWFPAKPVLPLVKPERKVISEP